MMPFGKKGAIPIMAILVAVVIMIILIYMFPGMYLFAKWMFSSGPQIGPVGIFFVGLFVVLYLRKVVSQ